MTKLYIPLKIPVFRRMWAASVLSNFGLMIQGVGVTWAMVEAANEPAMVAWVQTAMMLPLMLWSIPSGAIADVFSLRKVALSGLAIALVGAMALLITTRTGAATPQSLLLLCFLVGSGMALFTPAWQASVVHQVPNETLPQAIALNSISFNIARGFGPALGGMLVAWGGATAAFLCNVLCYIPLIIVFSF